jgi:hypothetical protein
MRMPFLAQNCIEDIWQPPLAPEAICQKLPRNTEGVKLKRDQSGDYLIDRLSQDNSVRILRLKRKNSQLFLQANLLEKGIEP